MKDREVYVVLVDVRSTHNVGSVFRTADAAGVSRIFLTGYTPTPKDRFGRDRGDLAKVALGAESHVPWQEAKDPVSCVKELQGRGVKVVAIEQDARAESYREIAGEPKVAFVFGNETKGLSPEILDICDQVVEIPMKGIKESLNVSVAAGIILFAALE